MSASCSFLSEDQFLCSICLDVFTDPVTIPCGHNYCKNCITKHWNVNIQSQCPICKEAFNSRPELRVNTFISEMVAQFRQSAANKDSIYCLQHYANRGEVLCDVCSEAKQKALKSCLICLTSYCETHLELHQTITGLKRHLLIDPVSNLEDRMCKKHDRPLKLFCKTDQRCVCQFCTESHHKGHQMIPMSEEYQHKKSKMAKLEAEAQEMISKRRLKIEQIKQSVKVCSVDADRETADAVQVFTAVVQFLERRLAQLIETIQEQQKTTESEAEGFIRELEEEITELMKHVADMEQLSHIEDHLQLVQSFASLTCCPPTKNWNEVRVHMSHWGNVRKAIVQLEDNLNEEIKRLCTDAELRRIQQHMVDVTLDPETASAYLTLSDDRKQVKSCDLPKDVPDNARRFSACNGVLGKQSFSSGRFYFEVQVQGKTDWDLGVASESVFRRGKIRLSPKNGFWTVWLRNVDEYKALAGPGVVLSLKSKLQNVGVFVDYEGGLVAFYDVDAKTLVYSFTGCEFTEKLHPYLSPCNNSSGKNTAPLVLLPCSNKNSSHPLQIS